MANDLTIIGDGAVPAHIAKRFEGRASNVMDTSISVPSLTFIGKQWSINIGSEKVKLITRNDEGDEVPIMTVPLVIIDYAKRRGRTFYEGAYDPDNTAAPRCYSEDGITPDPSVEDPISPKCASCQNAVKGSRVTDNGKATVACGEHRILCVVPAKKGVVMDNIPPLRLRIAVTSDYDGQSKDLQEKGQFAFSNYLGFLKQRSISYTDAIITKVSFDTSVAYPKLVFKADRWLDEPNLDKIEKLKESGAVETILSSTLAEMPAGGRAPRPALPAPATKATAASEAPKAETAAQKKKREAQEKKAAEEAAKATKAAEPEEEDEDDRLIREAQERKAAKEKAKGNGVAPVTQVVDALVDMGDDDGEAADEAPKATAAATAKADKGKVVTEAKPVGEVSSDVAAMLGEWD